MVIGCPPGSFFKTPPGVDSIRRQEPRWPEKIAAQVKEAGDSLAGKL